MIPELGGAIFRKSTRSNQGECVEVATNLPGVVVVRDSKDRDGGRLTIDPATWAAFIEDIKGGGFLA